MPAPKTADGYFVRRDDPNTICRVQNVDEAYAYIEVVAPNYSRWAMPVDDYDSKFDATWRPATTEDIAPLPSAGYRPPRASIVDIED